MKFGGIYQYEIHLYHIHEMKPNEIGQKPNEIGQKPNEIGQKPNEIGLNTNPLCLLHDFLTTTHR